MYTHRNIQTHTDTNLCVTSLTSNTPAAQFWRNERVIYERANMSPQQFADNVGALRKSKLQPKSVVPEVVDVFIRSPEPTPWRRKQKPAPEPTSSVESKAATVKKKARDKKKKVLGRIAPLLKHTHDPYMLDWNPYLSSLLLLNAAVLAHSSWILSCSTATWC